jgi:hypothetical protein
MTPFDCCFIDLLNRDGLIVCEDAEKVQVLEDASI